jgi:hypothetical protein
MIYGAIALGDRPFSGASGGPRAEAWEAGGWVVGAGWITGCNATSAAGGFDDGTRRGPPLRSARPAVPIGGESMVVDADHPIGTLGRRMGMKARCSRGYHTSV